VHIACVQLREVRDDLGRDVALSADERLDLHDQGGIGKAGESSENIVLHVPIVMQSRVTMGPSTRISQHII